MRNKEKETVNNIEKLSMEYYIEKRKWEQNFEFLKGVKGILTLPRKSREEVKTFLS